MPTTGKKEDPITFSLTDEQVRALKKIAGDRSIRLSASVVGSKVVVDFVACNSPFVACNSPFISKYGPYDKLQG